MLDGFEVISAKSKYDISSSRGRIDWYYAHGEQARVKQREIRFPSFELMKLVPGDEVELVMPYVGEHTSLIVGDFRYVSGNLRWGHYSDLVQTPGPAVLVYGISARVPYWSIVIPQTLVSAWLLLNRPRKPNLKPITEPVPETAT